MSSLTAAFATVEQALKSGQIGTPIAARILVHGPSGSADVLELVSQSVAASQSWLSDEPAREFTFGGASHHVSKLLQFRRGGSAIVSCGASGNGPQELEIVVFGNHGLLTWEGRGADFEPVTTTAVPDSTATPRYGVLLVAGHHTHQPNYAAAFAADPRCRLIGVTDGPNVSARRDELNRQLAHDLGLPFLPDYAAALGRDDVQIVSICAEPERRGPLVVQAAAAGKHLYLDKPLAGSIRDADAIVAAVQQAGVIHQMFSLVHTDAAARVRAAVSSGQLGQLVALHFDLTFAKGHVGTATLGQPRRESEQPDRFELPDGKRELTNIGVYPVVQLLWLLQRPVVRVAATTGNFYFAEHQQHNLEDFGQMLLELDDGTVATITAGRCGWRSSPVGGLNRVCLIGSAATTVIDANRPRLEVWSDIPAWQSPPRNPDDPLAMWWTPPNSPYAAAPKQSWFTPSWGTVADATYFLNCIDRQCPSDVPATLAADATRILFAAYRSAATGGIVTV